MSVTVGARDGEAVPRDDEPIEVAPESDRSRPHRWTIVPTAALALVVALIGFLGVGRHVLVVQPGGAVFFDRVLPVLSVLLAVGAAAALWRPLLGGGVGLLASGGVAPFAVRQLEPWSAALVVVAFALPAVIWTIVGLIERRWPRAAPSGSVDESTDREPIDRDDTDREHIDREHIDREHIDREHIDREHIDRDIDGEIDGEIDLVGLDRRRYLFALAGAAATVVVGSTIGRYVYDRFWGPTHPESDLDALSPSAVDWMWCGAVSPTTCTVRVRPRESFGDVVLLIGLDAALSDPRRVPMQARYDRVAHVVVDDLAPDTRYWYAAEIDGTVDRVCSGTVRTFPTSARPLRLAFGSCARTGSNGAVFDAIRDADPDVYVCLGDFHYGDITVDDVDRYRQELDVQLTRPAQSSLYRSVPIAYVWDDHDYGPNNSDRTAPGRAAAMATYREYVPHYDLAGPRSAIFQAFTIGTVRVIMTDGRSARDPRSAADGLGATMLGEQQRRWLLDELVTSAPDHDAIIWVNPVPWVDPADAGADTWAGFAAERELIAEHIAAHRIDHLVMVSGDAHMVAIDDGAHTNYSSTTGPAFPLLHVAALDRPGSTKGGPYTKGPIAGGGHFGVVDIDVTSSGVDVALVAKDWRGDDLLRSEFTLPRPARRP